MSTESSKVNDAANRAANESSLMKRNKRELVGFILRKDIVETNLTKEVTKSRNELKLQYAEIEQYKKELEINDIKLVKANKRKRSFLIVSCLMGTIALIELLIILF